MMEDKIIDSAYPIKCLDAPVVFTRMARPWERLLAFIMDTILINVLGFLFAGLFLQFGDWAFDIRVLPAPLYLVGYMPTAVYWFILEVIAILIVEVVAVAVLGQSIGKKIMGIQILRDDGQNIGLLRAIVRAFVKWSFWILSISCAFNRRKAVSDYCVGTHVIKLNPAARKELSWRHLLDYRPTVTFYVVIVCVIVALLFSWMVGWGHSKTEWLERAMATRSIKELDALIERYPDFYPAYLARATCYGTAKGDIDRAIRDTEAACRICPQSYEAQEFLALAYTEKIKIIDEFLGKQKAHANRTPPSSDENSVAVEVEPLPVSLDDKTPELLREELLTKATQSAAKADKIKRQIKTLAGLEYVVDPAKDLRPKQCFVVTAACGNPEAFEVKTLCKFRDRWLLPTTIGQKAIWLYYQIGPSVAQRIDRHEGLRLTARVALQPIVWHVWALVNWSVSAFFVGLLGIFPLLCRSRR